MKQKHYYILFFALCAMLCACSSTKYVPEGDYLYKGTSVKVRSKAVNSKQQNRLSEELENIMRPRPNRTFLGMPVELWIYNFWGTPGKEKGPGNWISRKFGQEPVLLSDVQPRYQRELVVNRLENRGYFNATLESDSTISGKKIRFDFVADPGRQYLIDTIYWPQDSAVLSNAIRDFTGGTFLKKEHAFDLDVIRRERERIDARLKEHGFYYFSPDHILVLADTTNKPYTVSLSVTIKPGTPRIAQEKFSIRNIYIYPRHSIIDSVSIGDSVVHNEFIIIDRENTYKPSLFEEVLAFRRGDVYNRTNHNRSLNKLIDLGVFKYVENRFREVGNSQLDAHYYLTSLERKSLRVELQGRNTSSNFTGAEVNVSWQNRNTFAGAENLRVNVYGGTDFQISGINKGNNLYRVGAEVNLNIPRFLAPFKVVTPVAFIPRTRFTIGYDKLNRVESYVLNSFRASFGYNWRENIKRSHELTVFGVNYIQPSNISAEYQQRQMEDPTLANAIQRQFIMGPNYTYNATTTTDRSRKHTYYYNGNIDLSGNLPGLISGASFKDGDTREILNAEFSQYVKTDHDIRYYNDLGRGSSFAARLFLGFGFPYGNSKALPL